MQHDSLYRINVIFNKNKWKEEQVFEKIVLFIQSVGGTQYLELGTAVNRITYFLLPGVSVLMNSLSAHSPFKKGAVFSTDLFTTFGLLSPYPFAVRRSSEIPPLIK